MSIEQLTLEHLKVLDDGRVQAAFQQELSRAVMDCMDRPGEEKERKVILEFSMCPITGQDGALEGCSGEFRIKGAVPKRVSKTYHFQARRRLKDGRETGMLVFSSNSPENFNQYHFDDLDDGGRVDRGEAEME